MRAGGGINLNLYSNDYATVLPEDIESGLLLLIVAIGE